MAFAVLIVPTSLMGATLPLVIKSSAFRATGLGERMALLYGINTAGAIVGALASGLYLIPDRGIHGTFLIAASVNLIVGLSAIIVDGGTRLRVGSLDASVYDEEGVAILNAPQYDAGRLRLVLWVFAASGFTSLALEVVWSRVLTLFLRPTVYGFALMLAAVLAGIAIGSWAITPFLDRPRRWIAILGGLELAIGIAAVLSFGPLAQMPGLASALTPALSRVMGDWLVYPTVGSLLAIFPTALLMGIAFPIGLRLWTLGNRDTERTIADRVGTFYSLNVAGAILGAIASGFFLVPRFGSKVSLVGLGGISLASGILLLAVSELRRSAAAALALVATIAFGAAVWQSGDPLDEFVAERYRGQRLVWHEEGVDATVAILSGRDGELSMTVNGNHQASTDATTSYIHHRIGHLPMLLHPEPHTALVIGLGGGATAGAVSVHDNVKVDVVELAGAVVRGARFFDPINHGLLDRPNVSLRVDDGRNFLMMTRRKYDVVTADVIHPIFAGSGNVYSVEYFELLRRVLNPGGIVLQWVAGTDAEYKFIVRTFLTVFPQTSVWGGGSLLVGSVEPLRLTRREFDAKMRFPGRALGARELGAPTFDDLLKFYRAGPDDLREFVGPGPILTDDRPLVEYFLSLPRDRDADLSQLKQGDVGRVALDD
jgi:spermidine synthase